MRDWTCSRSNTHRIVLAIALSATTGLMVGWSSVRGGPFLVFWVCVVAAVIIVLRPSVLFYATLGASVWWLPLASLGGLNVTLLDLVLLALTFAALTIGAVRLRSHGVPLTLQREILALLIWVMTAGVLGSMSTLVSSGLPSSFAGFLAYLKRWGEYAVVPLTAIVLLRRRDLDELWAAVVLVGVMVAVSSILLPGYPGRAMSLVFNPNVFGLLCVIVLSSGVSHLGLRGSRALGVLAVSSGILGIIVSGSRSAGFAALGALLYWLWVFRGDSTRRFRRRHLLATGLLLALGAFIGRGYVKKSWERWSSLMAAGVTSPSISIRLDAWRVALRMAMHRFFLGYGIGQVPRYGARYVQEYATIIQSNISTSDNQYIDILLESGIVGLSVSAFVFVYLWGLSRPPTGADKISIVERQVLHVFRSALVGFLIAGLGVPAFSSPFTSSWLWILLALGLAAKQVRLQEESRSASWGRNGSK